MEDGGWRFDDVNVIILYHIFHYHNGMVKLSDFLPSVDGHTDMGTSRDAIASKNDGPVDLIELDLKIKEYGQLVYGGRRCTLCDKIVTGSGSTNFRNHFERNHMEGISFECPNCDKTFRSRGALNNHKHQNCKMSMSMKLDNLKIPKI